MDNKVKLILCITIFLFAGSCRNIKTLELPQIYHHGHPKKCEACDEVY